MEYQLPGTTRRVAPTAKGRRRSLVRVEPCYVFHPMNAYDDVGPDGHELVVLDVISHERVFDEESRLAPDESLPSLWRWTIDLNTGTVKETQLDDVACEFPRVDERLVGRRHRYGFAVSLTPGSEESGGVSFEGSQILCRDADSGRSEPMRWAADGPPVRLCSSLPQMTQMAWTAI